MAQEKTNPSGAETRAVGGEDRTVLVEVPPELGPYRLTRLLGRGGMGEVWLAFDTKLEREVAVKLMRRELLANEEAVKRFQREARAVAKLNHPNIVQVYTFGDELELIYFVMEMVEGETVTQRLKRLGPQPLEECVLLLLQTVEGLSYASARGVIHRDIKPSNLMITRDFRVKIADFGLAKIMEQDTQMTAVGTTMGSPNYMSPEQARGEEADPRSDTYSLGITFYQMLTGQLPFQAATPLAVLMKQIHEPLPETPELAAIAGGRALAVIRKMTEKDPEQRYQTYGGVAAAISGLAPSVHVHAAAASVTVSMPVAESRAPQEARTPSQASVFSAASTRLEAEGGAAGQLPTAPTAAEPGSASQPPAPRRRIPLVVVGIGVGFLLVLGSLVVAPKLFGPIAQEKAPALRASSTPAGSSEASVAPVVPAGSNTAVRTEVRPTPVSTGDQPASSTAAAAVPTIAIPASPTPLPIVSQTPVVTALVVTPAVGGGTAPPPVSTFTPTPGPEVVSVRELQIGGEKPVLGTKVAWYDEVGAQRGTLDAGRRVEYLAQEPGGQRYRVRVDGAVGYVLRADGWPVIELPHVPSASPSPAQTTVNRIALGIKGAGPSSRVPVYMDENGKRELTSLPSGTVLPVADETGLMYRVLLPEEGRSGYVFKTMAAQARE